MRFALRNKTKLINAFDEDYYNLLIESLKQYFANNRERKESNDNSMVFLWCNIRSCL